jgi:hypothetical protein
MTETDSDGVSRSYLATEENFRAVKAIEEANLLVPVVGNFAGTKAVRAVAQYLTDHGARVSAFYTSNVEQYLFQSSENWRRFYANTATLPIDDTSVFIRAYFNNRGFRSRSMMSSERSAVLLDPIVGLLKDLDEGRIQSYGDLFDRSR